MIVQVAVNIPLTEYFDYKVPPGFEQGVAEGIRVLVPLGKREAVGVVVGLSQETEFEQLKDILEIIDSEPVYSQRLLEFTKWISRYYFCGWAEALEAAIPSGIKPVISRKVAVTTDPDHLAGLDQKDRSLLLSLDGKPDQVVNSKACRISRNKIASWRKKGLIRFLTTAERKDPPGLIEEWAALEPANESNYRPKADSKADIIIRELKERKRVRLSDLRKSVKNALPVIRKLVREGLISLKETRVDIGEPRNEIRGEFFKNLNKEQQHAFNEIKRSIDNREFQTFFLFGVTGSGKTEVYLHAVRETLKQGRTALVLIPEISLTPQAVSRFQERFGKRIAVLHSGLTKKERAGEWWKIRNGRCDIVIGARSAIFAPLENIGLIVVDEEHDSSYKQQETPFYNARDGAVKCASDLDAVVILGSATPSIESFHNTRKGKYRLLQLTQRANLKPLPITRVISLKDEKRQKGVFYLSTFLVEKLRESCLNGKQSLVFLNRRGFASFLSCKDCDLPHLCHNCSIAMTWHKSRQLLICHHCGYSQSFPRVCQSCGQSSFRMEGIGTQRVEQDLSRLFPDARFLRMDRDSIQKKGSLEKNIELINNREVDFIIGTQLISKGHDFKHIGMVCIILADMSLNIPDFRSSERSFQLISQVSGRAGRDEQGEGSTLVQTYNPGHFAVTTAVENDYPGFFREEIELRRVLYNPPFSRLILLKISNPIPDQAQKTAEQLGEAIRKSGAGAAFQLLGPIESPISKVNNRFYWQLLIKTEKPAAAKGMLRRVLTDRKKWKPVGTTRISVDVDPYMLL